MLEQAAQAVRDGGDVDDVLAEVQLLLSPGTETNQPRSTPDDDAPADGSRKAARKAQVREWYVALPAEVRDQTTHAIVKEYAAELVALTGVKVETVRTEYLNEIRRELGEGSSAKG